MSCLKWTHNTSDTSFLGLSTRVLGFQILTEKHLVLFSNSLTQFENLYIHIFLWPCNIQLLSNNIILALLYSIQFNCLHITWHLFYLVTPWAWLQTGAGQKFEWTKVQIKQNLYILSKNQFQLNSKRFYCLLPHHSSHNILNNENKQIIWAKYLLTRTIVQSTFCPRPLQTLKPETS